MQKHIFLEKEILADIHKLWMMWTEPENLIQFFAPKVKMELKIGGPFEMYFNLNAPSGKQGSEGMKILSFLPEKMLSFEWNAPPDFPEIRGQKTWVVLLFEEINTERSKIKLYHLGWKSGGNWEKVYEYFIQAWEYVLNNLSKYFEKKSR